MDVDTLPVKEEEVPRRLTKRQKGKLKNFIIVTETNLDKKTSKAYGVHPDTKELYLIKPPCNESVSSTTTSSEAEGVFDPEWLSEKDKEKLAKIVFEEQGHHRRMVRRESAKLQCQQNNKIAMLEGLRIQQATREALDKLIEEALNKEVVSVNLNAFLIMEDGKFVPFNVSRGGILYELSLNKHQPVHIERTQLLVDMMHHQNEYKQLLYIFQYLDRPPETKGWGKKLPFIIYKRPIELVAGLVVDELDFWERVEHLFTPNTLGFYYAIIVCFGLFEQGDTHSL